MHPRDLNIMTNLHRCVNVLSAQWIYVGNYMLCVLDSVCVCVCVCVCILSQLKQILLTLPMARLHFSYELLFVRQWGLECEWSCCSKDCGETGSMYNEAVGETLLEILWQFSGNQTLVILEKKERRKERKKEGL